MTERIIALARQLGGLGQEENPALEALCRAAQSQLEGRLRQGITVQNCEESFILAAAWLALAGLAVGESGGVERFTAGSVTIQERGGGDAWQRAMALRRQAEGILAPYLEDSGFVFRGVTG